MSGAKSDSRSNADERAPLLGDDERSCAPQRLSSFELAILCWARCGQNWAYYIIYPILPDILRRIGIGERELGYYTGLVESSYSAAQFVAFLSWTSFADRFDRKQVLCVCLSGMGVSAILFGFTNQVWQMVACRAVGGFFSALALTVRVYVAEAMPSDKVTKAYSLLATSNQLTVLVAPLVGASLYAPLGQKITFFGFTLSSRKFPALLPATGNAMFIFGALLMTLTSVRRPGQSVRKEESSQMSLRELLQSPGVAHALALWGWYCTIAEGIYSLTPLVYYTGIPLGGLSFSPRAISAVMAGIGICGAVWALFVLPHAVNRRGHLSVIRTAGLGIVAIYSWPIIANELRRGGKDVLFYTLLPLFLAIQAVTLSTNGTSQQLMLNSIAPPGTLGRLAGIGAAQWAAFSSVSPSLWGSIFAAGVEKQLLKGHLVFVILVAYAVGYNLFLDRAAKLLRQVQQ